MTQRARWYRHAATPLSTSLTCTRDHETFSSRCLQTGTHAHTTCTVREREHTTSNSWRNEPAGMDEHAATPLPTSVAHGRRRDVRVTSSTNRRALRREHTQRPLDDSTSLLVRRACGYSSFDFTNAYDKRHDVSSHGRQKCAPVAPLRREEHNELTQRACWLD